MQISRLFEIVYILLRQEKATARELAAHFEVSQRTIYRDIEALCQAGVPVRTDRGAGGGIALMDGFVLNSSVLSEHERHEILSALQGLRSVKEPGAESVLRKLTALFGTAGSSWIEVDFSGWGSAQREKFEAIKTAVLQKKVLEFDYFSAAGEKTHRITEPVQLWFKNKSWYLLAFCRAKQDVRMFKLNRVRDVRVNEESFWQSHEQAPGAFGEAAPVKLITIRLWIDSSLGFRVYDEFDELGIECLADGCFNVTARFPDDDWVAGYILSFGPHAKVLEPARLAAQVKERLEETLKLYS